MEDGNNYTHRLVSTGRSEPDPKELEAQRAEILRKLQAITPDQLEMVEERFSVSDIDNENKELWMKTIWAK